MKKLSLQFYFDLLTIQNVIQNWLKMFASDCVSDRQKTQIESYEWFLILMWGHLIVAYPKWIDPFLDKKWP